MGFDQTIGIYSLVLRPISVAGMDKNRLELKSVLRFDIDDVRPVLCALSSTSSVKACSPFAAPSGCPNRMQVIEGMSFCAVVVNSVDVIRCLAVDCTEDVEM